MNTNTMIATLITAVTEDRAVFHEMPSLGRGLENARLMVNILSVVDDTPKTCTEVACQVNEKYYPDCGFSCQKVAAMLTKMRHLGWIADRKVHQGFIKLDNGKEVERIIYLFTNASTFPEVKEGYHW